MAYAVADSGVTADEWAVLSAVGVFGPVPPTRLSTVLRVPPTSITRYVARLVGAGLLVRVSNADDGRSYLLELSSEGRAKVQEIAPRFRAIVADLEEHADVRAIEVALVQLEEAAKAVTVDRDTAGW